MNTTTHNIIEHKSIILFSLYLFVFLISNVLFLFLYLGNLKGLLPFFSFHVVLVLWSIFMIFYLDQSKFDHINLELYKNSSWRIVSIDCNEKNRWTFCLTDGNRKQVYGDYENPVEAYNMAFDVIVFLEKESKNILK